MVVRGAGWEASDKSMRLKSIFWTVSLVIVFVASACAPATSVSTLPPALDTSTSTAGEQATQPVSTQAAPVQAVATSRGPNLEATDPSTVELASGQLQLVEFFRFT